MPRLFATLLLAAAVLLGAGCTRPCKRLEEICRKPDLRSPAALQACAGRGSLLGLFSEPSEAQCRAALAEIEEEQRRRPQPLRER